MEADNQTPEIFGQTPWQTVGPFFHYQLPWKGCADLTGCSDLGARLDLMPAEHCLLYRAAERGPISGEPIRIIGRVLDANGTPVPDALLEIWQANAAGRYHSPADPRSELPLQAAFAGFGRAATAADGTFHFRTIMPGPVPGPGARLQAPHIAVGVLGRGLIKRLVTRIYFEGDAANETDPILAMVPASRRHTLIARRTAGGDGGEDGVAAYCFDVHLQGERETVFFDC
ncbi:MAG TPA: protocatechuate 3,4-dioxygenase subunit alpha [Steroidobacteraceae bacterium]|jgi:protocatechuate 3,4-dioxygenase alpha subunit|nr:protocatechuate 3,4-dioxygenase subunit alpha [Steroidobacteraceae bacterium]